MRRFVGRSILSLAIATAAVGGGRLEAQAAPPAVPGLAAQMAALQATVATLTGQIATLQGAAGTVETWHAGSGLLPVQRNDATNVADWTLSTLVSLDLPPGSFVLTAKTSVQDPDISASTFYCFLVGPSGFVDQSVDNSTQDEPATLALQAVVTLSSAATVSLQCGATGPAATPGSAEAFGSKLAAIKASLQ